MHGNTKIKFHFLLLFPDVRLLNSNEKKLDNFVRGNVLFKKNIYILGLSTKEKFSALDHVTVLIPFDRLAQSQTL